MEQTQYKTGEYIFFLEDFLHVGVKKGDIKKVTGNAEYEPTKYFKIEGNNVSHWNHDAKGYRLATIAEIVQYEVKKALELALSKETGLVSISSGGYGQKEIEDIAATANIKIVERTKPIEEVKYKVRDFVYFIGEGYGTLIKKNEVHQVTSINTDKSTAIFTINGKTEKWNYAPNDYYRLATPQEIEQHLIAEAGKKGLITGKHVKFSSDSGMTWNGVVNHLTFNGDSLRIKLDNCSTPRDGIICIYTRSSGWTIKDIKPYVEPNKLTFGDTKDVNLTRTVIGNDVIININGNSIRYSEARGLGEAINTINNYTINSYKIKGLHTVDNSIIEFGCKRGTVKEYFEIMRACIELLTTK